MRWLAVLRCDDEHILAVLGEACVNDNLEPVGSAIAANTVQQASDGLFW